MKEKAILDMIVLLANGLSTLAENVSYPAVIETGETVAQVEMLLKKHFPELFENNA